MKRLIHLALAGSILSGFSSVSSAQTAPQPGPAASSDEFLTEVVVTARRREESLQDVPEAITPITSAEIERLNILEFNDIGEVAAGLTVGGGNISMRGVTYTTAAATFAPTTATYLNDAPTLPVVLSTALFDIGQIEVLRGPQGTLHGIATPSGAITLTTRKPDLDSFGVTAQATLATLHENNLQAAVNLPLITDKLAVRIAAAQEYNDANNIGGLNSTSSGVRSINDPVAPFQRTDAGRITVRFQPTDSISGELMYQNIETRALDFTSAVFGNGSPGGINPNAPAGYNGPVIGEYANLAVSAGPTIGDTFNDNLSGQLNWDFAGQRLSYVGSWQKYVTDEQYAEGDQGNTIPGYAVRGSTIDSADTVDTDELRIASVDRIAGLFDYVGGVFHERDSVITNGNNGAADFLPGSFGPPSALPPEPVAPNTRYELDSLIDSPRTIKETSIFGNLTAHVTDKLEISAGTRHIFSSVQSFTGVTTTPAFAAVALPANFCALAHGQYAATYPGVCDVPVAAQQGIAPVNYDPKGKPWIYDASISYHFNQDLMAYVSTGSSWRQGPITIGIENASNNPALTALTDHPPETSKSYEAGVKWSFPNHRGRLNVDYFHQTFNNLIYTSPYAIYYLAYTGAPNPTVSTYPSFVSSVPAKVDGFDIDVTGELTRHWTASGNLTWADSRLSGASIPCNSGAFNGVPDSIVPTVASFKAAGQVVAFCNSNTSASSAPKWNANIQSEYDLPVVNSVDAFLRGLLNYQPSNPFLNQTYVVPSYALLNMYLGVRDPSQKWEVSLFAKNLTDTNKVVTLGSSPVIAPAGLSTVFGGSGYTTVSYTPRRQFGINLRYSFGSG
jgi:iron complex outermembrane receptor protein